MKLSTGVCLFAWFATASLRGQDLTWSSPQLLNAKPDAPKPEIRGLYEPSVPDELAKLNEVGYAELTTLVAKDGRVASITNDATSPWIASAAMESRDRERIEFPTTANEPFYTLRQHLIYNPRQSQGKHNKLPRALLVNSAKWPGGKREKQRADAWINAVGATLDVSATGDVVAVKLLRELSPTFAVAIETAAKQWKFEPAHDDEGVAVPSSVGVNLVFEEERIFPSEALSSIPVVVRQAKPEYPLALRGRGQGGQIIAQFVVDTKGDVVDPQIVTSNNEGLNEPAIDALRKWRFKPGKMNGEPVNTLMQIPMIFSLDNGKTGGQFEVSTLRQSNDTPEALKYDYPPTVKNAVHGVYPLAAIQEKKTGKVNVRFLVLPSGRVRFVDDPAKPLSDFDRAARAMLQEFTFTPASKAGKPTLGLLSMEVNFSQNSESVGLSDSARRILKELKKKEPQILQVTQVDEKPHPIARRAPIYPAELEASNKGGEALIDIYIDENGAVQLPSIVSCTEPAMGYCAVQAASEWTFRPMTAKGKPAVVHARIPFKFNSENPESDAADGGKKHSPEQKASAGKSS